MSSVAPEYCPACDTLGHPIETHQDLDLALAALARSTAANDDRALSWLGVVQILKLRRRIANDNFR